MPSKWFCKKCKGTKMRLENDPISYVIHHGMMERIEGEVCNPCTQETQSTVLMPPLPEMPLSKIED